VPVPPVPGNDEGLAVADTEHFWVVGAVRFWEADWHATVHETATRTNSPRATRDIQPSVPKSSPVGLVALQEPFPVFCCSASASVVSEGDRGPHPDTKCDCCGWLADRG